MPPRKQRPVVEPLDAYATAKPDEPTFTLQGGDPLAPHLVRIWAAAMRSTTGLRIDLRAMFEPLAAVLVNQQLFGDKDITAARLRATQAEMVSWKMDEYLAGSTAAESEPETAGENSLEEKDRLDLHDLKVRYAQRISNMFSDLSDMWDELSKRNALEGDLGLDFPEAIGLLKDINSTVEPRRLFHKDS